MAKTAKKINTELPYNADAERVVLGCAMLNKDYCLDILTSLEEEDFFYDKETDTYFFVGYKVSKNQYDLLREVLK